MTDELQTETNDSGITFDTDHIETEETTEATETQESGADLAPATGENQPKNENDSDGVQKAINKQHAKYREEERKRIQIEKEAKELREKLEAIEAERGEIIIPAIPDPFDDDFEEKVRAREEAIAKKAAQDAQKNWAVEQQQKQQEAAAQAERERLDEAVANFGKRSIQLGIDPAEMRQAEQTVLDYGVPGEIIDFLLQDSDGPLITQYLAKNPLELDELRSMAPMQAAIKINSGIREAASTLKPQATAAPDPAETLTGRGAGEPESPHIAGATFE